MFFFSVNRFNNKLLSYSWNELHFFVVWYLFNKMWILFVRNFILEFWICINKIICRFFVYYLEELYWFSKHISDLFSLDLKSWCSSFNLPMNHLRSWFKCRFSTFGVILSNKLPGGAIKIHWAVPLGCVYHYIHYASKKVYLQNNNKQHIEIFNVCLELC